MRHLEVGKPYTEGVSRIPEGIVFDFNRVEGYLRIAFDSPLESEINEITQGKIKLGLLEEDGIIFFFAKFGSLAWMETPYNVAFYQPYTFEELPDEKAGYAVQVVLLDGMTGIVKALKLIELPHLMSKQFKELVERQLKNPVFGYDSALNRIYSRYSTDDLVSEAEIYSL
jgi:hypothetical protein